jgi:hypothetical protein
MLTIYTNKKTYLIPSKLNYKISLGYISWYKKSQLIWYTDDEIINIDNYGCIYKSVYKLEQLINHNSDIIIEIKNISKMIFEKKLFDLNDAINSIFNDKQWIRNRKLNYLLN